MGVCTSLFSWSFLNFRLRIISIFWLIRKKRIIASMTKPSDGNQIGLFLQNRKMRRWNFKDIKNLKLYFPTCMTRTKSFKTRFSWSLKTRKNGRWKQTVRMSEIRFFGTNQSWWFINIFHKFQQCLFLRITTLLTWLKSTLYYWRINALIQLFIWKHNVYKQMRRSIMGKENAWQAGGGVEKE